MTTNVDLTNRALALSGTRSQITGMTDGSTEALYANLLYNEFRDFMLREGDYDWALKGASVVALPAPALPWVYAYVYPSDAIRIRTLITPTDNPLDPQPVEWNVVSGGSGSSIVTKTAVVTILYTFAQAENEWDAIFTDSFVRLLASGLIFALENRIEASKESMNAALAFAQIANMRDS